MTDGLSAAFTGVSLAGNQAGGGGGAVALTNTPATATACRFSGNGAGWDGGALLVQNATLLQLGGLAVFHGNSAGGRGGAVAALNVTSTLLSGCTLVRRPRPPARVSCYRGAGGCGQPDCKT
jgi:predicted outer membrane repeat protein